MTQEYPSKKLSQYIDNNEGKGTLQPGELLGLRSILVSYITGHPNKIRVESIERRLREGILLCQEESERKRVLQEGALILEELAKPQEQSK